MKDPKRHNNVWVAGLFKSDNWRHKNREPDGVNDPPLGNTDLQFESGPIMGFCLRSYICGEMTSKNSKKHSMPVLPATSKDIPFLIRLINSAYRGDASRKG